MFAGEYLCKVDEKGRFIVPSPIREQIEAGTRQLAAGEYTDYDPQGLRNRFDDLKFSEQ